MDFKRSQICRNKLHSNISQKVVMVVFTAYCTVCILQQDAAHIDSMLNALRSVRQVSVIASRF